MMSPDLLSSLEKILQLGWPAIVTLACWMLWRVNQQLVQQLETLSAGQAEKLFSAYVKLQEEYVDALREIAGLRTSKTPLAAGPRPVDIAAGRPSSVEEA